ncbi:hypothetical protein [Streptomyces tsukubensis]|uniref:hypothetical protein n=1 Tax=Streptomyces tsukubensis TaxID=83656 RepID=UPI00344B098D
MNSDSRAYPLHQGVPVPYIAAWSGEQPHPRNLIGRPRNGLGYGDETAADRDRDGALWQRMSHAPGSGVPDYGRVHPLRQRETMQRLLCQVCRAPASRTDAGFLFLLPDHSAGWPRWPERMICFHPPVCDGPCIEAAARYCPHLARGIAARSTSPRAHGVYGTRHRLHNGLLESVCDEITGYESSALPWVLATQMARLLHGCSIDRQITGRLHRAARQ